MISVIIPVYNIEKYLKCCVDTVLHQTYTDIEVILVDDGSTDGCGALCDEYAVKDERVRVIHRPNGGLSAARNSGIELARGEYIWFLDGDDAIHERTLELMLETMEKNDAQLVFCGRTYIDDDDAPDASAPLDMKSAVPKLYTGREVLLLQGDLMTGLSVIAWNKLYRTEQFGTVRYPEGRVFEDAATTHLVLYDLERVAYLPLELCFYRQRPGSIMTDSRYAAKIRDHLTAFWEQAEFYEAKGDRQLKALALDRYESNLAQLILLCKKDGKAQGELDALRAKYKIVLKKDMKGLPLGIKQRLKLNLFLISEKLYAKIREMK